MKGGKVKKLISQREARRLKKEVAQLTSRLEGQNRRWSSEWPGGVNFSRLLIGGESQAVGRIQTARALGHAVVVLPSSDGKELLFYAIKL